LGPSSQVNLIQQDCCPRSLLPGLLARVFARPLRKAIQRKPG
jgi:hypothetical protein